MRMRRLRIVMLWGQAKKREAARQLLEPILSSFAEELDAPDLRVARLVHAQLA